MIKNDYRNKKDVEKTADLAPANKVQGGGVAKPQPEPCKPDGEFYNNGMSYITSENSKSMPGGTPEATEKQAWVDSKFMDFNANMPKSSSIYAGK